MLDLFFTQSRGIQLLMLVAHATVVVLASYGLMRWLGAIERRKPGLLPVGPFFVSVSTLYALFLAFHASTIWSHQHDAEAAFRDAVTSISRLEKLLDLTGDQAPAARDELGRYIDAVVREEWPTGNSRPSPRAVQALDDLRGTLVQVAGSVPTAVADDLFRVFDELVRARSERIWVGAHNRNRDSWYVVLVLGLLAHVAIGVVHMDRPRAGLLALVLFAVATTASYRLLTDALNPFVNVDNVDPGALWAQIRVE